ncbi:MAG: type II secretion system protein [Phycisphaerales bacterium]
MRAPVLPSSRSAFTLIELLVVIGIIAILTGIGLAVGFSVLNSGRANLTTNTLTVVETVLVDLNTEADLRPRDYEFLTASGGTNGTVQLPLIDARADGSSADASNTPTPSLGRFLKLAEERLPSLDSRWKQLDASLVRTTNIGQGVTEVIGTEVLDAWGNPIRFVHPSFDGGYGPYDNGTGAAGTRAPLVLTAGNAITPFRRSYRLPASDRDDVPNPVGDADEGICPGGTPYFYSAGPDGDPGTRGDNVYGEVTPTYPAETRDLGEAG